MLGGRFVIRDLMMERRSKKREKGEEDQPSLLTLFQGIIVDGLLRMGGHLLVLHDGDGGGGCEEKGKDKEGRW